MYALCQDENLKSMINEITQGKNYFALIPPYSTCINWMPIKNSCQESRDCMNQNIATCLNIYDIKCAKKHICQEHANKYYLGECSYYCKKIIFENTCGWCMKFTKPYKQ